MYAMYWLMTLAPLAENPRSRLINPDNNSRMLNSAIDRVDYDVSWHNFGWIDWLITIIPEYFLHFARLKYLGSTSSKCKPVAIVSW